MEKQNLYWEIEDFTGSTFALFSEGKKIFSQKLSIKDVEKQIGKKLKVCPSNVNPEFIIGARVKENGTVFIDSRRSLRGTTQKYYILAD